MSKTKDLLAEFQDRGQRSASKKSERALLREISRLRGVLGAALDLRNARGSIQVQAVKRHAGTQRQATAFAMASDWHVEEIVDPRKVGDLNRYSPRIAAFRSRRFFAGIAHLITEYRKGAWDIRNLVLILNGDLLSGYIHEELQAGNAMSPIEATLLVTELISAGLTFLAKELPEVKISIPCQVGNHGRTTHKVWASAAVENSYEFLAYSFLAKAHPECSWQLPEGRHSIVDTYGFRTHIHHGDTVKSMGGIGGVLVPLNRAAIRWREKYRAHASCVGHFHTYAHTPTVIMNGSLIGYSMYADSLPQAAPEDPAQAFWLIDSKRGMCQATPLWCSDPSEERKIWKEYGKR